MLDLVDIRSLLVNERRPVDVVIAQIAAGQFGNISNEQLRAIGLGRTAIHKRVAGGRLHPTFRGVHAVGHERLPRFGLYAAAALSYSPDGLVSHAPAAALHGLRQGSVSKVDVTVPHGSRRGQPGIRLHHVRNLQVRDRAECLGIPVTSVARTLLDMAPQVTPRQLERMIRVAQRTGIYDHAEILDVLARSRGHRGETKLRAAVTSAPACPPELRSRLEERFYEETGLPRGEHNVSVAGYVVDCLYPEARLIVELDGRSDHERGLAFEDDRRRDADLAAAGYLVLRFTWRRLEQDMPGVIRTVRRVYVQRTKEGAGRPPLRNA